MLLSCPTFLNSRNFMTYAQYIIHALSLISYASMASLYAFFMFLLYEKILNFLVFKIDTDINKQKFKSITVLLLKSENYFITYLRFYIYINLFNIIKILLICPYRY